MGPMDRYQIRQSTATRKWRVVDSKSKGADGAARVLIDSLTEKAAIDVKHALSVAFWDGASALKWGEVIL